MICSKNEKKAPWYAKDDSWHLTHSQWEPEKSIYFEAVLTQANGYMGFRGYREESDQAAPALREGYLAGMFASLPPLARRNLIHDYPWDSRQMVSLPEIFFHLSATHNVKMVPGELIHKKLPKLTIFTSTQGIHRLQKDAG